jgi:tripartite-type tricarboxylate transporter receptor subunit TctC
MAARWVKIAAVLLGTACLNGPLKAAELPDGPATVIVGFGPGGLGDIVTRLVANSMAASLGKPFVVQNMPGASGLAAATAATRAKPDGNTMLLVSGQNAASPSLFKEMPYNPSDLSGVSTVGLFNFIFVANKNGEIKDVASMIDFAKKNPEKFNIGTISTGSAQNLAALLFLSKIGLKAQTIPFKSTGELVTALSGGHIQVLVETVPGVIGQVNSGELRGLGVSSNDPLPYLPGVPTFKSLGVDFELTSWNGFMAPAKTPRALVDILNAHVVKALEEPDNKAKLVALGLTPKASTPEELEKLYKEDEARWRQVIADAKIDKQ